MTTQGKSKSKTFPKGTDSFVLGDWFEGQIKLKEGISRSGEVTNATYLITITKLPEKGEKE